MKEYSLHSIFETNGQNLTAQTLINNLDKLEKALDFRVLDITFNAITMDWVKTCFLNSTFSYFFIVLLLPWRLFTISTLIAGYKFAGGHL